SYYIVSIITSQLPLQRSLLLPLFFFNDPPPTEIYTLSLHDALPISQRPGKPIMHVQHKLRLGGFNLAKHFLLHCSRPAGVCAGRSEEHTSELQSRENLVCRLLLEKKKKTNKECIKVTNRTTAVAPTY